MKKYKEIFALALPNILSNISVPLISSVDTGLMGHLSAKHLAAIGSSAMIFNFLYWNFGFLRMGTTGLVAQAYGKQDSQEKSKVFLQAVLVALGISFTLILLQTPLQTLAFKAMNLDDNLSGYALQYFSIRIWDAPATLMLYIIMAWFFGNQNAIKPLILTIIINVANIMCSVYFVRVLDFGIQGVAYGTLIANYLGVFVGLIMIWKYHPVSFLPFEKIKDNFSRFWTLNRDIFLRTVMLSITFASLYSFSATFGTLYLAITVIVLQFTNWMSYAVDGFAYASEALVGKYHGAKNEISARETINGSMICGFVLAAVFSFIYAIWTKEIAGFFTDDPDVISLLLEYKWWIVAFPVVGFASYIWDGVFVGMTASIAMRNTMAISFVLYLVSYFILQNYLGYHALMASLAIYLGIRGLAQSYLYYKKGFELE